jgi:hypothetical protein
LIYYPSANSVGVDDYGVWLVLLFELQDSLCRCDGIKVAVLAQDLDFPALAHDHNRLVGAVPGNVAAYDFGHVFVGFGLIAPAGGNYIVRDELSTRCAWELAFDADPKEIAVLAVILSPLLE